MISISTGFSSTQEQPRTRARRWGGASGIRALGRGVCGLFLCAALAVTSGCITRKVWTWAGEGSYAFLPSRVTPLGLSREEGRSDRLFIRVDTERAPASGDDRGPGSETPGVGDYYVLEVPLEWKDRPRVRLPDDEQPGSLQLTDLLETKPTPRPADETLASLRPIPLQVSAQTPAPGTAPYAFIEGPPGILFIYGFVPGTGGEPGRWVRLSSVITGEVITAPAPKFNYAIAMAATPITAAVDAVGVVVYVILWPVWASMDIGYGDGADDGGYVGDGGYQPGRPQRELEKPRTTAEPEEPPPLPPDLIEE